MLSYRFIHSMAELNWIMAIDRSSQAMCLCHLARWDNVLYQQAVDSITATESRSLDPPSRSLSVSLSHDKHIDLPGPDLYKHRWKTEPFPFSCIYLVPSKRPRAAQAVGQSHG